MFQKQLTEEEKKKRKLMNQNINKLNPQHVNVINEQIRVNSDNTAIFG